MESQFVAEVRKSAEESFSSGLYCAESVLLALADAQGITSELLPSSLSDLKPRYARIDCPDSNLHIF